MSPLRVLYLTPELAPLTGTDDQAVAAALRCRALATVGVELTVVVPRVADRAPETLGLARRLTPLRLDPLDLSTTIHEGPLPAGGRVFAISFPPDTGDDPRNARFANAALRLVAERNRWPAIVHPAGGIAVATALADAGERWPIPAVFTGEHEVVPGIDEWRWRPEPDVLANKAAAKRVVQRRWGLSVRRDTPLFLILGPVDPSLLSTSELATLAALPLQLAVIGESREQLRLHPIAERRPTRVALLDGKALSPTTVTAADFVVLPHPFPSGTSDLFGASYGAIPIAPQRGDYSRSLVEVDQTTATGTGFLFAEVVPAIRRALRLYDDPASFETIRRCASKLDLSWQTAALRYLERYRETLR